MGWRRWRFWQILYIAFVQYSLQCSVLDQRLGAHPSEAASCKLQAHTNQINPPSMVPYLCSLYAELPTTPPFLLS